jgi:L-asparaginase II
MVAGDERICTDAMRQAEGKLIAKTGTEGGYSLSFMDRGLGLTFKVEDGAMRALSPVVVEILLRSKTIGEDEAKTLASHHRPQLKNHRKEIIGRIEPTPELCETDLT